MGTELDSDRGLTNGGGGRRQGLTRDRSSCPHRQFAKTSQLTVVVLRHGRTHGSDRLKHNGIHYQWSNCRHDGSLSRGPLLPTLLPAQPCRHDGSLCRGPLLPTSLPAQPCRRESSSGAEQGRIRTGWCCRSGLQDRRGGFVSSKSQGDPCRAYGSHHGRGKGNVQVSIEKCRLVFSIWRGAMPAAHSNVSLGFTPERVVLCFIDNDTHNGACDKNP